MFTSRAEYRLQLREDNADLRLTEAGRRMGLVNEDRWNAFSLKRDAVSQEVERLKQTWINPRMVSRETWAAVLGQPIEREYSLADLLRRPEVTYDMLNNLPGAAAGRLDSVVAEQAEIQIKYQGYIDRQQDEISRQLEYEHLRLSEEIDYMKVRGLSREVQQKLNTHRPETLAAAARISGITPAAISLLLVHLKRGFATDKTKRQSA